MTSQRGHEEDDDQISEHIQQSVSAFLEEVSAVCDRHSSSGSGSEAYIKRCQQVGQLNQVIDELLSVSDHMRALMGALAILPSRDFESELKKFARSRCFRGISQFLHSVADDVESLEDEWNDMVAPSSQSAQSSPSIPVVSTETPMVPMNTRRKGIVQ